MFELFIDEIAILFFMNGSRIVRQLHLQLLVVSNNWGAVQSSNKLFDINCFMIIELKTPVILFHNRPNNEISIKQKEYEEKINNLELDIKNVQIKGSKIK
ncbi:hypothetical protein ACFWDG_17190, partial [Peribacillus sp. NPDC060186]